MSVLITGGLGHVGSWIAHELASKGTRVVICDMAAGEFDRLGIDYLEEVRDKLVLESVDILDFHTIFETILRHADELEGVIHGVALIAGPDFQKRPYRNISINTLGTLNIFEVCRILRIPKVVNLSSGAVYGDAPGHQTEDTPYKATDLYGATKIAGELFGLQYADTYGLDVRNARLYFVYGPGKLPSRMHLVYQALFGPLEGITEVEAPNGADQEIDWTHVRDAARGVVSLFERDRVRSRNFNISSGVPVHHREIVRLVAEVVGRESNVRLGSGPFVRRGAPLDISRARNELGFEPEFTDIREGIRDYQRWLQKVTGPGGR